MKDPDTVTAGNKESQRSHDFGLGLCADLRPYSGCDELLAQLGAAAKAGDRQQLLVLVGKLVAAHAQDGDDDDLLLVSEVAGKLNCSDRTVWRLVARRKLPGPLPDGGKAKWFRKDVREYLERLSTRRSKAHR